MVFNEPEKLGFRSVPVIKGQGSLDICNHPGAVRREPRLAHGLGPQGVFEARWPGRAGAANEMICCKGIDILGLQKEQQQWRP